MSQEKIGKMKFTVEVEINEALMEVMKDSLARMPSMVPRMTARMFSGEKKSKEEE